MRTIHAELRGLSYVEDIASQCALHANELTAAPGPSEDIAALTDRIQSTAKLPAKSRSGPIAPLVERLAAYARTHGLRTDRLSAILGLVCSAPRYLDQASAAALMRDLYPAARVPVRLAHRVIASLGTGAGKPAPAVQGLLIRWLILVWEALEEHDREEMGKCYGILFGMIEIMSIRAHLCHLLALMTRRVHVKPFRIQTLLVPPPPEIYMYRIGLTQNAGWKS